MGCNISCPPISHALQYKREGDVPLALRRKLYRLAGLFELADEQFIEIRNERKIISLEAVSADFLDISVVVDAPIIVKFLATSKEFNNVIGYIKDVGYKLSDDEDLNYIGYFVEEFRRVGLSTLEDLNSLLSKDNSAFFLDLFQHDEDEEPWEVSSPFILLLLLILNFPNKFTVASLVETDKWGESVAELVLNCSNKYRDA